MNQFNKRSIQNNTQKSNKWAARHVVYIILALILFFFSIRGVIGAVQNNNFTPVGIITSGFTKNLEMDENGHTNILLIGVGGEGHDGENLTDTMIVASIDRKNRLVPMISIPRDLFVQNEAVGWGTRINSVYEYVYEDTGSTDRAMEELSWQIEDVLGISIQYYAKIDFNGFVDVIDAIGGIDVDVQESIYDATYPAPLDSGRLYEPFSISAGLQTLDGETALKYARSRHTSSDFDRARRQQEIISAAKDKALSVGFLLNPNKIKNTYYAISDNFETNLTITELLNLASMSRSFSSESIISAVISDDPISMGGMLYTPERELYGGAYVLVPYVDDFKELHDFADFFFYNPELYEADLNIEILNGTPTGGLAGLSKMRFQRYGLNVIDFGNADNKDFTQSQIFAYPQVEEEEKNTADIGNAMQILNENLVFGEVLEEAPSDYTPETYESDADIVIILGSDYTEYYLENEEFFYIGYF